MPLRLMVYLGTLGLEERPSGLRGDRFHLGAVVVNLTGIGAASQRMRWPGAGLVTQLGVRERNLATENGAATLRAVAARRAPAVVLPFIPLMRGGDEVGIIERWLTLASAEPDERRRADYGGLARVFATAADRRAVWDEALKGWNVIRCSVVEEWQAEALARGLAEGRNEGRIEALLELLQACFKEVPEDLVGAIRATGDLAVFAAGNLPLARSRPWSNSVTPPTSERRPRIAAAMSGPR